MQLYTVIVHNIETDYYNDLHVLREEKRIARYHFITEYVTSCSILRVQMYVNLCFLIF